MQILISNMEKYFWPKLLNNVDKQLKMDSYSW